MKTRTLISPKEMARLREQHHDLCQVLDLVSKHIVLGLDLGTAIHSNVDNDDLITGIRRCLPHVLQVREICFHEAKPAESLEPQFEFVITNIGLSRQTVSLSLGIPDIWDSGRFIVLTIEPDEEATATFTVPLVVLGKLTTHFVLFQHFNVFRNYVFGFDQSRAEYTISNWSLDKVSPNSW